MLIFLCFSKHILPLELLGIAAGPLIATIRGPSTTPKGSSDSHSKPRTIFACVPVVSALPPQRPVSPRRCRLLADQRGGHRLFPSVGRGGSPSSGIVLKRRVT